MPAASPGAPIGYLLAALTLIAAVWLTVRQGADRRRRSPNLPDRDARHFTRQDLRRGAGVVLMIALGVGLAVLMGMGPARDRPSVRLLVGGWLGFCVALLSLLSLALFDWAATNAYARRHRLQHRATLAEGTSRRERASPDPDANGTSKR